MGGLQKQIFPSKGLQGFTEANNLFKGLQGFTEAKILFKGFAGVISKVT